VHGGLTLLLGKLILVGEGLVTILGGDGGEARALTAILLVGVRVLKSECLTKLFKMGRLTPHGVVFMGPTYRYNSHPSRAPPAPFQAVSRLPIATSGACRDQGAWEG
jgi:hypothetical protein